MLISGSRTTVRCLAHFLVVSAALVSGLTQAHAQSTDRPNEQVQGTQSVSSPSPSSGKASEDKQQPSASSVICGPAHLGRCLKDIALDQAGIWTSPLRLRSRDALWLVPFAGATAVAIHYDPRARQELGIDHSRIDASNAISQFGSTYATIGAGGTFYLIGRLSHNDHLAETRRLGTAAVIYATSVAEALKLTTN